jgi:hypothetical protein
MSRTQECRLVSRALYPRWDRPSRIDRALDFCRQIGADELMLFPTGQMISPGWLDDTELKRRARIIAQVRRQGARRGVCVTINDMPFLDDGGQVAGTPEEHRWSWAVDITGQSATGYRCLLSRKTRAAAAANLLALAKSGVERIFLDDEVRLDWHPATNRVESSHFCFCPIHLRAFGQRLGRRISREDLAAALQSDRPEARGLREEWLAFKRDTFLEFVTYCREQVHRHYPSLRLGQMTTFSYFQVLGGVTFTEHVKAWAGLHRPLCRPAQGWYGDQIRTGLYFGLAQTLWTMQCLPTNTEFYSEIDWGGPWTQMQSSARMAADFQIRVNLLLNIKTHSLLYLGEGPDDDFLERRIVRRIRRSRKWFNGLARHLPLRAQRLGLQFLLSENTAKSHPLRCRGTDGDLADPLGLTGAGIGQPPWPKAFSTLARTGIPMTFGDSPVAVLTGGIAPGLERDLDRILYKKNLIIDGAAAADLQRRGLLDQFGLRLAKPFQYDMNERLEKCALNGEAAGEVIPLARAVVPQNLFPLERLPGTATRHQVISYLIDSRHHTRGVGMVLVDQLPGDRRACITACSLSDEMAWGHGIRKTQWCGILNWLNGDAERWPVWVDDAFDVWPQLYKMDRDPRCWVGLINFGHDAADDVTCWIGYSGKARVRFVDRRGQLQPIASRYLRRRDGQVGVVLRGDHAVQAFDTMLLVVDPQ